VSASDVISLIRAKQTRAARIAPEPLLEAKCPEISESLGVWAELLEETVDGRIAELAKALEDAREATSQIEHQALHDSLTGLPNRRYLKQVLDDIARSQTVGDKSGIAILHIDLDRFKQINDTRGHAAGDYVLCHTASVLKSLIRSTDLVARIGGDEFVMVIQSDGRRKSLANLASRIVSELDRPVMYKKTFCRIGASVGIAYSKAKKFDPGKLLINADIALYRAKKNGRGRHAFLSRSLQKEIVENQAMSEDMLNGLARNEFFPIYQPQFEAKTMRLVGVEAMVRWNHPVKGILAPGQFLKIAEDINVINKIDAIVLERAVRDIITFREHQLIIPRVSVNISLRRLSDPDLIRTLTSMRLPDGLVAFELVESVFLDDCEQAKSINRTIQKLKKLSIDIEIDDFGSGHASIVSLLRLNPTRLKISQDLVKPLAKSRLQRKLVQSIIEMAKALDIGTIAEGVETMEHARILRELGCDILQGFAFATAMTAPCLFHFLLSGSSPALTCDKPPSP
jgi:diguanylate cyclase (GGDEF)-like protein